jgi:hypothetical protein
MDDQLRFSFQQELYSVIWGEGYNRFVFQHFGSHASTPNYRCVVTMNTGYSGTHAIEIISENVRIADCGVRLNKLKSYQLMPIYICSIVYPKSDTTVSNTDVLTYNFNSMSTTITCVHSHNTSVVQMTEYNYC